METYYIVNLKFETPRKYSHRFGGSIWKYLVQLLTNKGVCIHIQRIREAMTREQIRWLLKPRPHRVLWIELTWRVQRPNRHLSVPFAFSLSLSRTLCYSLSTLALLQHLSPESLDYFCPYSNNANRDKTSFVMLNHNEYFIPFTMNVP